MTQLRTALEPIHHLPESDQLWSDYRPRLVVFARTFGGAVADCPEDTAHDIIARAIERIHLFDRNHAFSTWIYRLARNYCIDANRRRRRRSEILRQNATALVEPSTGRGPEETLERKESLAAIGRAIGRLSPGDQQIAFLRFYEELPVADVGEVMSKPVGTVKYRLHVILGRVRSELEEAGS